MKNETRNRSYKSLFRHLVIMVKGMDIKVISEGVETADQPAVLAGLVCDYGQGNFFSKPLSPESIENLLNAGISVTWAATTHIGLTHPRRNPTVLSGFDVKT